MICYIVQQMWTSAVSSGSCAFSNRQNLMEQGCQKAFHLSAKDLCIEKGPHGKPLITNHPDMFFNITHTCHRPSGSDIPQDHSSPAGQSSSRKQYYMAGAFAGCQVGIDCEYPRTVTNTLIKRVLAPEEKALVFSSHCPESFFLRLWTLKESYVKFTGEGLSNNPSSLCFLPDNDGNFHLSGHPEVSFLQFEFPDGLILSLCSSQPCTVQFITLKK